MYYFGFQMLFIQNFRWVPVKMTPRSSLIKLSGQNARTIDHKFHYRSNVDLIQLKNK